ncbi:hypothetical protein [Burkholderia pseudomallei]|uniref:hypothetical protein n=1 Tax=Burkholderia pseudomallei TaxID=28450 RepID=UPI00050FAC2F|nr:hypothetical protein [Burkholderia pseudomallei]KGC95981.1 hypothetical protein DP62_5007 [Burkholderia pseudomallei]KGV14218.1 hypothetical protein X881_3177 [Burkholderia pseudomallei MSHR4300]KGV16172.1 hypothetical protein X881_2871 [Burkholderia pseudomallei MSHR4300]KGV82074.1 hypothetical protein X887_1204 [Burkholderia pseudomallei MSHR4375]KKB69947.1 hypothetical protein BBMA_3472 [Burkholderia pseudomallei MSHR1079]
MNLFAEPLPSDDMDAEIRYRYSVRYVMLAQIAEFRMLKVPACVPWARILLRIEVISHLNTLGGLAGEW